MKYKEFAKKLAELDLYVEHDVGEQITIYTARQVSLAIIDDNDQYDLYFSGKCRLLSPEVREKFFSLAVEYASTPIEKRISKPKDEQKYIVVAFRYKRGILGKMRKEIWYYYRNPLGELETTGVLGNHPDGEKWTMQQIKQYSLEGFERIEVDD